MLSKWVGVTPGPQGLFDRGQQGAIFDSSYLPAMWQDSGKTTRVYMPGAGSVDPPVGYQLDLSGNGNHRIQATPANRRTLSGLLNQLVGTANLSTQNVTTVAIPYTLRNAGSGTITLSGTSVAGPLIGPGTLTFTPTAGVLTLTVTGSVTSAQLETGSAFTRYQAVVDASNYDTVGFPLYLSDNGTNTFMYTANPINFSGTAQMTVWAGVRKLSDAVQGSIVELSANINSNNGSLNLLAQSGAGIHNYSLNSKGTTIANVLAATFTAPVSNVVTVQTDISAPSEIIRVNGTQINSSVATQGTGNYGNYVMYFGSRAGSSLFFNGKEYGLIVRGVTSSPNQIIQTEQWMNAKMGGVY